MRCVSSDFANIVVSQFRLCILFTDAVWQVELQCSEDAVRVPLVFRMCAVFQILYAIIPLVPVPVVHFYTGFWTSEERFRNRAVYE